MHRKTIALVIVLAVTLMSAGSALACKIAFAPKEVKAGEDGTAVFTVWVKWEHRRCVLADDDITVDYKGAKALKSTGWVRVKRGLFKNTFKVQLEKEAQKATVRVWRECSKKGLSEGILTITR